MENNVNPFKSPLKTIKLPSGKTITIREQNGDDDTIISRLKNANDGTSIPSFVAAITMEDENKKKPTIQDVMKWKVNDIYVTVLKSRLFSLGKIVDFTLTCPKENCKKESSYEEDLSKYDWDYTKPFPEIGSEDYNKYRCKPYANGQELERVLTLSSGKEIKYKCRTGESETLILEMPEDSISKNTELTIRKLQLKAPEGKYLTLSSFTLLSARDMKEIRKDIADNDPVFEFASECICTNHKCKNALTISVLTQPNFFFPVI